MNTTSIVYLFIVLLLSCLIPKNPTILRDWRTKRLSVRLVYEKVSSDLGFVFNIWLTFNSNRQSHVHNVIKKLPNKCPPIIVNIFGNVLVAKIILNPKRENVVFIVLMEVLSVLLFRKERTVKWKNYLYTCFWFWCFAT